MKECGKTFQVEYVNKGILPEIKKMIVKMALNGSGVRDTSRVLEISTDTVTKVLKKTKEIITSINKNSRKPLKIKLEMDEMRGRVHST